MGTKLRLISAEEVEPYLHDEWTRDRLYNIDYSYPDRKQLAMYRIVDLSEKEIIKAIEENQYFLLDES